MPLKIRVAVRLGERYHTRMINLITFVALTLGAQDTTLSVIPRPLHMTRGTGEFAVHVWNRHRHRSRHARHRVSASRLVAAGDWLSVVGRQRAWCRRQGGIAAPRSGTRAAGRGGLPALGDTDEDRDPRVPSRRGVLCRADHAPAAAPDNFRQALVAGLTWSVPVVEIEDMPRFPWRGAHLDVSRSFMPKEFVKKYIDLLALHKLNRFPLALTDDQGWRIEIKKYPRLTSVGAWRRNSLVGVQHNYADTTQWVYDNVPHGGFYTQDDVREVVAYAQGRFITVVPEIEMPGHAQAAIAAYPGSATPASSSKSWRTGASTRTS